MKKSKNRLLLILLIFTVVVSLCIRRENTSLTTTYVTVSSESALNNISGLKIVHISDLHNAEFGHANSSLLEKISSENPDIIAVTGDIIDSRRTNTDIAVEFTSKACEIAPVYYVTGNHEARIPEYASFEAELINAGANVLRNNNILFEFNGVQINLIGADDPSFSDRTESDEKILDNYLNSLSSDSGQYKILLSHRPELFETYVKNRMDIVLCGHAHGGQFRIPFIGGVIAPNQGFFPKYTSGVYTSGNTNMVVSRGLGNSIIPFRINNPPEIVVITIN
ncbi:metallophosphoesterase [Anaerotignum faecicola]|nr:metallophosphoesterase [Anaerotignum faecicola]